MSFSFGSPSSAPASTGLGGGGFSFGANKPATPGFGLAATSQPSTGLFGSTATTSAPAFGATTPAFGSTPAFVAAGSAPAFGSTAAPSFGAIASAPSFGSTATPTFGSTASPAFGTTTSTAAFGATSASSAFGATSAAPTLGGTGLGLGLTFGAGTNTTACTGLSFGAPATTTTASSGLGGLGGLGFGPATTSAGFGLLGSTNTATSSAGFFGASLGGTSTAASVAPSLGLGGVSTTTSGIGANTTTTGENKAEQPKQQRLPNEILNPVESFKEFVKKQKALSSEVMRVTAKPLYKVSQEVENTLRSVVSLAGEISRARAHSKRLRSVAAAALAAAEAAAPQIAVSELEGSAPPSYVKELIAELEQQVITFRRQMEVADKQMQASPKLLTEHELTLGMRRMHESLVALAGRLQAVHTQVEAQKEQYLNLRKYILKDPTNVFDVSPSTSLDQILHDAEGTRRKTKLGGFSDVSYGSYGSAVLDPRTALGSVQQLAGPTPFSYLGNTLSPFPNADNSAASWTPQPQGSMTPSLSVNFGAGAGNTSGAFQLQKPPGKRVKQ